MMSEAEDCVCVCVYVCVYVFVAEKKTLGYTATE
jgi:hypothetical protein